MKCTISLHDDFGLNMPRNALTVAGAKFPLRVLISPKAKEEFQHCEQGSWEDAAVRPSVDGARQDDDIDARHVYEILKDGPCNAIVINNANEALVVYTAACSGTLGLHGYLTTARRICDKLRPFVPAEWLKLWPRPDGY